MKFKVFVFGLLLTTLVFQIFAREKPKIFRGAIAGKTVQITLRRDGDKLSGTYFYSKIGKDLKLVGTINLSSEFKLEEFDANNVKTGEIDGKWTEAPDENGIALEGNWKNPKTGKTSEFYANQQMIDFSGDTKLISKSFSETNKQKLFEITAEYPQLTSDNSAVAAKVNETVKNAVMKDVNQFRSDMLAMTAEDLKFMKQLGVNNYLELDYAIEFANDNVISISFSESTFSGGAHPNHNSFTINYDLKNNKEIKLAELFKPNSNYLKTISDYCIQSLKVKLEEMSDDDQIKEGAGALVKNFKSWNITQKGILINFDPYQVAAYAAGPQEVLIPYGKLKSVLRDKFVDSVVSSNL